MGVRKNYSWTPLFIGLKSVGDSFEVTKKQDVRGSLTMLVGTISSSYNHYCNRNKLDHEIAVIRMGGAKLKVTRIK